nr:adenosylcobinamide-GDP ribazoletransferase [Kineosphaera limosa]
MTAWRVPPPHTVDHRTAGTAMLLAPLTQLPLLVLLGVGAAGWLAAGGPLLVLAVLLVGATVLSTRGMHIDGLADTADGLSASYDPQRALTVMKSPDVGPSGVAAVVLALALQIAALSTLPTTGALALAAVALLLSRQVLAIACHRSVPPISGSGLGQAVAGTVSSPLAVASGVLMLAVALLPALLGQPWWAGLAVVLVGWVAAAVTLRHAVRRLGGINGDVLGATIEITFAAGLATAALVA